MGSTDSAGNTHSGGSSCGLVSSLFPNRCRGRAESFARRLHRRLTSLGGEGLSTSEDEDDDSLSFGARGASNKVTEASWLHAPTGQRLTTTTKTTTTTSEPKNSSTPLTSSSALQMDDNVLDSQPRRSPESDVYYDFDLETYDNVEHNDNDDLDVTTSPAEIANDADLVNFHVNETIETSNNHNGCSVIQAASRPPEYLRDSESGCVFESPLPGTSPETDNSEVFFDPETSETEKTSDNQGNETFRESRGSETLPIANGDVTKEDGLPFKIRKHPLRRRIHRDVADNKNSNDDTSESSSSSCNPTINAADSGTPEARCTVSSEESLNGTKSSLETTTSPSHESLWSTFDESTLSLQDEPSAGSTASLSTSQPNEKLAKSHSDSEIIGIPSRSNEVDEVDKAISPLTNGDNKGPTESENSHSTYCSSIDIPGALVLECPSGKRIPTTEENLKNQVNLRIGETNGSDEGMSRLLERLACNPRVHKNNTTNSFPTVFDDNDKQKTNGTARNDEKAERCKTKEQGVDNEENEDEAKEEEEEENDENNRPQRLRRCSSLKTGKTPPGTPGRKKIVRFADVLGLDLADVRTFLDEIPKIPNSAYSDLIYDEAFQKDSSPVNFWGTGPATFTTPLYAATMPRGLVNGLKFDRILVPLFQQPGGSPTFLDIVRERQVCLENIVVQDPVNMCLHGTVRVRNLDFHKSVHVRYTFDSWRNFSDLQATYAPNSCDGFSDKFTFLLYCHTLKIGQRLELAVRFQCKGAQYWDNNSGVNYCFQCLPSTSSNPGYIPITASTLTTSAASSPISHGNNHDWSPAFY